MHLHSHVGIVLELIPSVVAIGLKLDFRLHEEIFRPVLNLFRDFAVPLL